MQSSYELGAHAQAMSEQRTRRTILEWKAFGVINIAVLTLIHVHCRGGCVCEVFVGFTPAELFLWGRQLDLLVREVHMQGLR